MKVECLLEKFKNAILQIERVSGKNLSLPILGSILLTTGDNKIILRATNLNIGAEITIPAKIIESGNVAVSATLLGQICSGLQGDIPISLETANENLVIKAKGSKMTLKSMMADDFPTLPKVEQGESFEIPSELFIQGVKSVAYAASGSDIKPEISSIYIYSENEHLIFVATDAFRLAEKKIPIKGLQRFPEILLPVKNINEITRILGDFPGNLSIYISENQITLSNNHMFITSRLTGGNYPNYRQIMPSSSKTEIILLKSDIQSVLKSILVFSDKFNQIDLSINPAEKKTTISSQNNDTGEGIIELEAAISGDPLETRMNHRYISDGLSSITTDSVSLSFTESNRPMIMKGVGDTSFTYLVMPMNR